MMSFSKGGWAFDGAIWGCAQYVALTLIAMWIYPGGTYHHPDASTYIFSENFLSDLGRTVLYDGAANPYASTIYLFTLSFIGISAVGLFIALPRVLSQDRPWHRWLARLMTLFGVVSGLGFVGVAVTPSDINYPLHLFFVDTAFKSLLLALALLMVGIYKSPPFPNGYGHALLGVIVLLAGYVLLINIGPSPTHSQEGMVIQVVGQKIIVYTLIISLGIQAFGAKRVWFAVRQQTVGYSPVSSVG